jgi:hypothetical protein
MNATLIAETEALRRAAERLERVGLVVDPAWLSREHRLAYFAWQCLAADGRWEPEPRQAPIGFAYPNAR